MVFVASVQLGSWNFCSELDAELTGCARRIELGDRRFSGPRKLNVVSPRHWSMSHKPARVKALKPSCLFRFIAFVSAVTEFLLENCSRDSNFTPI